MTKLFDIAKPGRFALALAAPGLVAMFFATLHPATLTNLAQICSIDAAGNIVPSKVAEGQVAEIDGAYFVQEPNDNATLLSRCGKGGCAPLDPRLVQGHVGSPVRAELCRRWVTRLTISGEDVFRLTQAVIDTNADASNRLARWVGRGGLIWCCLCFLVFALSLGRYTTA